MRQQQIPVPEKHCERCGNPMHRKRYGFRLEDRSAFLKRQYCSQVCSNTRGNWGISSTAHHREAQKHVEESCEQCGRKASLHVHHLDGDCQNNSRENLQTLCASCHKKVHLKSSQPSTDSLSPTRLPSEWCDCAVTATPSTRSKRKRSSKRTLEADK